VLDLFDRHACKATFFILGDIVRWYPALVKDIAARGHEIACHGLHHVDITVLGPDRFRADLIELRDRLADLTGTPPVGYRAPNLVYAPWATAILEDLGFVYDSTVCASRSIGGKYKGWRDAPTTPYFPSYANIATPGDARLVELPLPSFPLVRVAAGSGIMTRVIGYQWTAIALRHALRRGDASFYFHPWEVGRKPAPDGHALRNAIFLRHTGPWMMNAVSGLLTAFAGRLTTARDLAERFRAHAAVSAAADTSRSGASYTSRSPAR